MIEYDLDTEHSMLHVQPNRDTLQPLFTWSGTFLTPTMRRSRVWGSSTDTASTTRFAKNSFSPLICRVRRADDHQCTNITAR